MFGPKSKDIAWLNGRSKFLKVWFKNIWNPPIKTEKSAKFLFNYLWGFWGRSYDMKYNLLGKFVPKRNGGEEEGGDADTSPPPVLLRSIVFALWVGIPRVQGVYNKVILHVTYPTQSYTLQYRINKQSPPRLFRRKKVYNKSFTLKKKREVRTGKWKRKLRGKKGK